jgi:hypothetical protein
MHSISNSNYLTIFRMPVLPFVARNVMNLYDGKFERFAVLGDQPKKKKRIEPTAKESVVSDAQESQEGRMEDHLMTVCTAPSVRAGLHPAVRTVLLRDDLRKKYEIQKLFQNERPVVDTNVWHDE